MAENSAWKADFKLQKTAGIFDCLYDGCFTLMDYASDLYTFLGYTADEFQTLFQGRLMEVIFEEDWKSMLKSIKEQLDGSCVFQHKTCVMRKNGQKRCIWISAEAREDAAIGPWLHCTFHDITDAKEDSPLPPDSWQPCESSRNMDREKQNSNDYKIWKEGRERVEFLLNCIAGGMTGCYLLEGFPLYFINSRMLEFLGYESQEEYDRAVGGLVINSVFLEDREQMETQIYRQLEEKNEYEAEFRMVKKDGSVIWVNEKGRRTTTVDGREAVISLGIDISLQKEYENQLALYRKASSGGAFIIRMDEAYTILYGNDIFYQLYDITKEEMAARSFQASSLVHPDDLPMVQKVLNEAISCHCADCQWEMRIITGKGEIKWFLVNGTFENKKEGLVMNGFVTDRTEKHVLEQELVHKELVYRTALKETQFRVWEYDVRSHALVFSGFAKEKHPYGERLERVPAALIEADLIHPGSSQELIDMYQKLDRGEPYVQADLLSRYQKHEDWSWQHIRYTMVYDDKGNPDFAVAVCEDITKQKEAEMQYQQELQLRMTFNDSFIASFRCNLDSNLVEYAEGPSLNHFAPGMSYEELMEFHSRYMAYQEDVIRLEKLMGRQALYEAYGRGQISLSFEYRRKDKHGRLFWVCAAARLVKDVHNGCLYIYGTLHDINEKKMTELAMKNRAEHDMLTGVYNKDTAVQMISDSMKKAHRQKASYAFLSFQVNHFAQIVHDSGYGLADKILKEVAEQLQLYFTSEKIIGRFYGDEFIVYVYNNPQPEMIKHHVEKVQNAIAMPYMFPEARCPVSLFAGIVFDNDTNSTFASLYQKAHLALSAAKTHGIRNTAVYSKDLEGHSFSPEKEWKPETGEPLLLKCLYSLSCSADFKESLESTLKELGGYFKGDRVYVIEMDWREEKMHKVYEWHEKEAPSIKDSKSILLNPEEISEELYGQFQSLYYEKDIYENKSIRPQVLHAFQELGVQSFFMVTLDEENHPIGYMGIDNPRVNLDSYVVLNTLRYVLFNELTKHRLQEKQKFLSCHDELTGVLNRYSFREYREELSEEVLISLGVVSLDINGLKKINQRHGNSYGDEILRYLVRMVMKEYKEYRIYRLAGDEFLVICENISFEVFLQKLDSLKEQMQKTLNLCIGSAWSDTDIHLDSLINSADEKRMIAKQAYFNDVQFDSSNRNAQIRRLLLAAMKQNHFFICLQPKVDSRLNRVYGAEALIRYQDSTLGLIPPGKFIPHLEAAGLIHYIDFFVLEEVCMTLSRWKEEGLALIPISLNFSRSTLLEDNLIARMEQVVSRYQVERSYLEIEITESLGEVERETITRIGNQISQAGYRIALDDFGAKYSNISFLSMLHFHHLKLDKGLVNNLITNHKARLIVKNILNLCRELHVGVIAEGVESEEQLEILKELECYYIQGYYYDKPVEVAAFEERYQKSDR